MANQKQVDLLKKGIRFWNSWREEDPEREPELSDADLGNADLSHADLGGADLSRANLSAADLSETSLIKAYLIKTDLSRADLRSADLFRANLSGAYLSGADLTEANMTEARLTGADLTGVDLDDANLTGANLSGADISGSNLFRTKLYRANLSRVNLSGSDLTGADLTGANLSGANLSEAHFSGANLSGANLSRADLSRSNLGRADLGEANLSKATLFRAYFGGANLSGAILFETDLTRSVLADCHIQGLMAWNVRQEGARQSHLIISTRNEPIITVDNLEVAQFIQLLLHKNKVRTMVNTIAKKAVLILGHFSPERRAVLNVLRKSLHRAKQGYLPIVLDFDKPYSQDLTETITTLVKLSHFIIVDLTDSSYIPGKWYELLSQSMVAMQPIFHPPFQSNHAYEMFQHLQTQFHWVLPTHCYTTIEELFLSLPGRVIQPVEQKAIELKQIRQRESLHHSR